MDNVEQIGDWMSAREAAIYLRIIKRNGEPSLERLRNLVSQGMIPSYKPYGRLLFKKSELKQIVEKSKREAWRWR